MAKSADAFRTISEVAEWLDTPAHVLRFWESRFTQIKPIKRAGGRRYYRPADMLLLGGIKKLLHDDGITIKAAQNILRENGIKHVQSLSQPVAVHVSIKKKSAKVTAETPIAVPASVSETIDLEQMNFSDTVTDISVTEQQDMQIDGPETTHPAIDSNMPLKIAKLPANFRAVQDISPDDLQDIEALYFSLKMVRNNMQRSNARA